MKKVAPKILPGCMELLPDQQIVFDNMKNAISQTYKKFGFLPMDTPVIESADVLLAKAGGETEKQIYRFAKGDNDLCLRFDLTVPLARYVSAKFNQLSFPLKRFQIGKVYRGERPQKGRFREFYQCDVDIVGNEKLDTIYDAEIAVVVIEALKALKIGEFTLHISNRKLLSGLLEEIGIGEKSTQVLRVIDKLAKIGDQKVVQILVEDEGLETAQAKKIIDFCQISGGVEEVLLGLKNFGIKNPMFCQGVLELETVTNAIKAFGITEDNFVLDLSIARGLDYYTGTVYETFLKGKETLGSIASGGRYDNLASAYTDKKLPGVGLCIGLTRLFDVLQSNDMIDQSFFGPTTKVLVVPMWSQQNQYAITVANELRKNNVCTEVFFEDVKFKNKMQYANKSQIPFAIIVGEDEVQNQVVSLKDLQKFTQTTCTLAEAINIIKNR